MLDGEAVLVAEEGGPLLRIALPSGERSTLIEGPVGEFVVLDDPRYILWRGPSEGSPDSDCCVLQVFDRENNATVGVGHGTFVFDINWMGEWVWSVDLTGLPDGYLFTVRNYVTDAEFHRDGDWFFEAPLSSTKVLIRLDGEPDTQILDVGTGQLRAIDFPNLPWPERTYDDGLAAPRGRTDGARRDLMRLPFDTLEPEVQAENVPEGWLRTHGGNVLFIDRDDPDELGPLVLVERDGRRSELATDVSSFTVPHHGTDRERNEVIYFVATGDDRGMWRLLLP